MPEIDFDAAKNLQSRLTKSHNLWGPRAAPFASKSDSLGQFVSKLAFALGGAEPDYLSVTFDESAVTVFLAAGEFLYLANADSERSSVRVFPFELDSVKVQETPNVLQSPQSNGFNRLVVEITFADIQVSLPGQATDANEESLSSFFSTLVKHLKR